AALEIKIVGFGVLGVVFDEALLLLAGQLYAYLRADLLRDLVLNGLDVRPLAVKLIVPEAAQVAHIHQFDAERQAILAQGELARQYRLHVELPSHFLEVEVFAAPFITGYRAERPHLEAARFIEAFDNTFRDTVAEVLRLGIAP